MNPKSLGTIPSRLNTNQNGLLIIQALQDLNRPATIAELTQQLAIRTNARQQDIARTIKFTLVDAVSFGFIQQHNGKYCIMPTKVGMPLARRPLRKSHSCGYKLRRTTTGKTRRIKPLKSIYSKHIAKQKSEYPLNKSAEQLEKPSPN